MQPPNYPDASAADHAGARRFVRWTLRWGRWLWAAAILLAIPAAIATGSLYAHLKSDIEELLPRAAPSVRAIDELRTRMSGLQYLGVMVDVGTPENLAAGERLLDDLATRVRAYPPSLVRRVRTGAAAERTFVKRNAALFVELDDLRTLRERIEARKKWELSRSLDVALDDEPPPPLDFSDLERKYEGRLSSAGRSAQDRFSSPELKTTLLLIEVGQFSTGTDTGRVLLDRVRADLAAMGGPDHYAPGMRVGFTGDVAVSTEEITALATDLTIASVLVIFAVMTVIVIYFKWWRSIPVLLAPLLTSTVLGFGVVTLPPLRIRELNSNTAFLGSIIIGNGINFGIVLLARYLETRRRGHSVEDSLVEAVWGARLGTFVAALAAGIAYASLVITQFRGFRQFGVIGGIGMIVCWCLGFLLIPPLISWLDRGAPQGLPTRPARVHLIRPFARWVSAHPRAAMLIGAGLTAASLVATARLDSSRLETDFSQLRRRDTWKSGEGFWGRRMDELLGRYLTPTVMLCDSVEQARALAQLVRERSRHAPLDQRIAEVRALDDVLPRDQDAKLSEIGALRKLLTPATRAEVDPQRLARLDELLGTATRPFTAAELPEVFTSGLRERDGSLGRTVLVYPKVTGDSQTWRGSSISEYVEALRTLAREQDPAHPARVAGSLPLSADIISSIRHDGPLASAVALGGVVALVFLMFGRRRYSVFVVGSLAIGVLWQLGAILGLDIKINFVNFIAFPITFGIGVDYAVNVASRYMQDGEHDIEGPITSTGAAVGLCSLTTILGYSSLLLAKNHGLFLFGVTAVLGEITCLSTALLLMPSGLLLWQQWRLARQTPPVEA